MKFQSKIFEFKSKFTQWSRGPSKPSKKMESMSQMRVLSTTHFYCLGLIYYSPVPFLLFDSVSFALVLWKISLLHDFSTISASLKAWEFNFFYSCNNTIIFWMITVYLINLIRKSSFKFFYVHEGPCGGKTTGQAMLSTFFENLGWKVFRSPEIATILLGHVLLHTA